MQNLIECKKCLYKEDHPFGITFKDGICSGCITHAEKDNLDWVPIKDSLLSLIYKYKKLSKSHYDCLIPVKGDAEDYFVVSKVLEMDLKPLLVSVNDYFLNDIGWHNLHNLITYFDLDSFIYTPNESIYKELVRTSLRRYMNILLPSHLLFTSFPVHVAVQRKIPLIIWGQLQSVEQVGKFSHLDKVRMSRWNRREHDLFGLEIDKLIGTGSQLNEDLLDYYKYPRTEEIERSGIIGIYLSNYLRWDPLWQNSASTKFGFKPQKNNSSFDIYERAGSSVYYGFHDLLKMKKLGYRKSTDHLVREIRHGRIKKVDAKKLLKKYNNSKVSIDDFFDWLEVEVSGREWFFKHHLSDFFNLIGNNSTSFKIENNIDKHLHRAFKPKSSFIRYGKGISL